MKRILFHVNKLDLVDCLSSNRFLRWIDLGWGLRCGFTRYTNTFSILKKFEVPKKVKILLHRSIVITRNVENVILVVPNTKLWGLCRCIVTPILISVKKLFHYFQTLLGAPLSLSLDWSLYIFYVNSTNPWSTLILSTHRWNTSTSKRG